MDKPEFDPNQPFQPVMPADVGSSKPAFDPTAPFAPVVPQIALPATSSPSKTEALLRGLGQGATLGVQPIAAGALEAEQGAFDSLVNGTNAFGDEGRLAGLAHVIENYRRARDTQRAQDEAASAAHPVIHGVGEFAGAIPLGIATGGESVLGMGAGEGAALPATQRAINAAQLAAAAGGIQGFGSSRGDLTKGQFGQVAKDTLDSALLGGSLGGLGAGVLQSIPELGEAAQEQANISRIKALGPTKKQIQKLMDADQVQDLGQFLKDTGAVTPLSSRADIENRLQNLNHYSGQYIGNTIDQATKNAGKNVIDAKQFVDSAKSAIVEPRVNDPSLQSAASRVNDYLTALGTNYADSGMSLSQAQELKRTIATQSKMFKAQSDDLTAQAYRDLYGHYRDAIDAGINQYAPENSQDFAVAKDLYGNTEKALDIVGGKLAREEANRYLSPTDYFAGGLGAHVAGQEGGGGVAQAVGGVAGAVANHALRQYGNQVAASAYDLVGKALTVAPNALGKYAPVLQAAAARGGSDLAVKHFVLQQSQPEYREILKNLDQHPSSPSDNE